METIIMVCDIGSAVAIGLIVISLSLLVAAVTTSVVTRKMEKELEREL